MILDLSYEASLAQQYAYTRLKKSLLPDVEKPHWVTLIEDLVFGAGYSYSRIAYRMDVAPSTIQKIATKHHRKPRLHVLHALIALHQKVFMGQYVTPRAKEYLEQKQNG